MGESESGVGERLKVDGRRPAQPQSPSPEEKLRSRSRKLRMGFITHRESTLAQGQEQFRIQQEIVPPSVDADEDLSTAV